MGPVSYTHLDVYKRQVVYITQQLTYWLLNFNWMGNDLGAINHKNQTNYLALWTAWV